MLDAIWGGTKLRHLGRTGSQGISFFLFNNQMNLHAHLGLVIIIIIII